jgi:hypothetical protein
MTYTLVVPSRSSRLAERAAGPENKHYSEAGTITAHAQNSTGTGAPVEEVGLSQLRAVVRTCLSTFI